MFSTPELSKECRSCTQTTHHSRSGCPHLPSRGILTQNNKISGHSKWTINYCKLNNLGHAGHRVRAKLYSLGSKEYKNKEKYEVVILVIHVHKLTKFGGYDTLPFLNHVVPTWYLTWQQMGIISAKSRTEPW